MKQYQRNTTLAILAALTVNLLAALPTLGALNYALSFNGTSAYLDTGTAVIPASGDFTMEAWFNCPAATGTRREILSQGTEDNAFYIGADELNNFTLGNDWVTTELPVPGGWHHLALVKSSEDTILYLDGVNALNLGSPISNPDSSALLLGCQHDGTSEYWIGSLDDVRIWNTARSADQIQSTRFATLTGTEPGLVANWQFNEGRGTSCAAVGSSPVAATLMNGPRWLPYGVWTSSLQLNGANPLVHTLYDAFTDPGATLTTPVMAVAGGAEHSLAVRVDGSVVGWGRNNYGQITVPASAAGAVAVAAGDNHSLALKADGQVIPWGRSNYGLSIIPASATNVIDIAAGSVHSLVLRSDGTIIAWGRNNYGQTNVPPSATNVTAISAKYNHNLALKADGTVVAWGNNSSAEANVPASVTNVTAIAAGKTHYLALRADGTVIAWGINTYGETNVPATATNVKAIAAGDSYSLAVEADGTVVAWGTNTLAPSTTVPSSATNVMIIAEGYNHSLAMKTDGTVVAWGQNNYGQTNTAFLSQTLLATDGTVDPDTAGTYTLTYSSTNALGAVISATRTVFVREAILAPPVLTNLTLIGGSIGFTMSGSPGQIVVVETCTNLVSPVWVPLQTNTLGSDPVIFSTPVDPQSPKLFYRLRSE